MSNLKESGLAGLLATRRWCYWIPADAFIEGQGYRVSVVIEGESGHYPTGTWPYTGAPGEAAPYFWGETYEGARGICRSANARMGLTAEDVEEIVHSSITAQMREK